MTSLEYGDYRIRVRQIPRTWDADEAWFDVFLGQQHVQACKEVVIEEARIIRRSRGQDPGPSALDAGLAHARAEINNGLPDSGGLVVYTTWPGDPDTALRTVEPLPLQP